MDDCAEVLGWIILLVIAIPMALAITFDYFTTSVPSKGGWK